MSARTSLAPSAVAPAETPELHRGTSRVHLPAVSCDLGRVSLPERDLIFRHVVFGKGHSFDVVTARREGGREHNVRVPLGCLGDLRAAIEEFTRRVRDANDEVDTSVPGRGVPRGSTTPPTPPPRKDPT